MSNSNDLSHPADEREDMSTHDDYSSPYDSEPCEMCDEYADEVNTLQDEAQELRNCIAAKHEVIAVQRQQIEQLGAQANSMTTTMRGLQMTIASLRYQLKVSRCEL